ncbi:MAG TPA: hypothetical protein PKC40_00180 [Saprospiraceae bacterium]|nr:hypothetical protein [Saprospiraceae bacterium]
MSRLSRPKGLKLTDFSTEKIPAYEEILLYVESKKENDTGKGKNFPKDLE